MVTMLIHFEYGTHFALDSLWRNMGSKGWRSNRFEMIHHNSDTSVTGASDAIIDVEFLNIDVGKNDKNQ